MYTFNILNMYLNVSFFYDFCFVIVLRNVFPIPNYFCGILTQMQSLENIGQILIEGYSAK